MYAKRTMIVKPNCTRGDMYRDLTSVHHVYMAKKQKRVTPRFKAARKYPFLAWRKYRGLTQEAAAERIGEWLRDRGIAKGYTHATLGRLENGLIGYTEPILEAMAFVYQTDPGSLLMRDPTDSEAIWSVWDIAKTGDRQKI